MYGLFPYIAHENQPSMKVNIPYMDGMGNTVACLYIYTVYI